MKKNLFLVLCAVFCFTACTDYSYPNKTDISEKNGTPVVDSAVSYVLENIEFKGQEWNRNWNVEVLAKVNNVLKAVNEPILYNFYLNRNIYRFILVSNDSTTFIVSVNGKDDNYWLSSKKWTKDENGTESYITRTQDLSKDEWKEFQSLLKLVNFYVINDWTELKDPTSFCFVEAHEKNKYWYVLEENKGTKASELVAWVINKSKMKLSTK